MNTKSVLIMLLLAVFCSVCFTGHTQQVVPTTFNVLIVVTCQDATTKLLIESYIMRELHNLRDVRDVIVNPQNAGHATHAIWITVHEPERLGIGKTGGIAIFSAFTEFMTPILDLTPVLETHIASHNTRLAILTDLARKDWILTVSAYRQSFLVLGETVDMQSHCKNTVAAFDRTALQITRKRR